VAPLTARLRAAGCVFAEDEAVQLLEAADAGRNIQELVARRVRGEPLEHVLGHVDFAGLRLVVGPGVFVPRVRTTLLVEEALTAVRRSAARARHNRPPVVLVEMCCGCAPIAAAVAYALGPVLDADGRGVRLEVHAADLDPVAVGCAQTNVARYRGHAYVGDLYAALPEELRGRVDVLAVNAPYVPSAAIATMPAEARTHEPRMALDGGPDGLDLHRRVAGEAVHWLAPDGVLLLETSRPQAAGSAAILREAGLRTVRVVADEEVAGTAVRGFR